MCALEKIRRTRIAVDAFILGITLLASAGPAFADVDVAYDRTFGGVPITITENGTGSNLLRGTWQLRVLSGPGGPINLNTKLVANVNGVPRDSILYTAFGSEQPSVTDCCSGADCTGGSFCWRRTESSTNCYCVRNIGFVFEFPVQSSDRIVCELEPLPGALSELDNSDDYATTPIAGWVSVPSLGAAALSALAGSIAAAGILLLRRRRHVGR